jgi:hypothetical protein
MEVLWRLPLKDAKQTEKLSLPEACTRTGPKHRKHLDAFASLIDVMDPIQNNLHASFLVCAPSLSNFNTSDSRQFSVESSGDSSYVGDDRNHFESLLEAHLGLFTACTL